MQRPSLIISEVYREYQTLADQKSIELNLDLNDQSGTTNDPEALKTMLAEQLESAIARAPHAKITITLKDAQIVLSDTGTILSKPLCRALSRGNITVTSRVGFGTKVVIDLKSPQKS